VEEVTDRETFKLHRRLVTSRQIELVRPQRARMSVRTPAPSPSPSTIPERCASEAMPWSTSSRTARVGRASLRAIATSAQASCSLATFPPM